MAERTTSTQGVLVAVEETTGTKPAASAFRRLRNMGISLTPNVTTENYKPQGQKYTTAVTVTEDTTNADITGRPTYDEIVWPLSSVLTDPVITLAGNTTPANQGSRVMTDGNFWFWRPLPADADNGRTLSVVEGSVLRAHQALALALSSFTLSLSRTGTDMSGSGVGNQFTDDVAIPGNEVQTVTVDATGGTFTLTYSGQTTADIAYNASAADVEDALEALSTIPINGVRASKTTSIDPDHVWEIHFGASLAGQDLAAMTADATSLTGGASTATVTETTAGSAITTIPATLIQKGHVCVYMMDSAPASINDTSVETDANLLGRLHSYEWSVSDRFSLYEVLRCDNPSVGSIESADPGMQLSLSMQANEQGMSLLDTVRAGSTKFIRMRATGPAIDDGGSDDHQLRIDMAGKVSAADTLGDDDGIYSVGWTLQATPALTNGGPVEAGLTTTLTGF